MGNVMGNLNGRGQGRQRNANVNYRYNGGGSGLYFGDHFVMGGEEFAALDPEAFLFGDMADLNYLARLPGAMSRPPPNIKHTNTSRCLYYVHKDSMRLVNHNQDGSAQGARYHIDFTFDADAPCKVSVYFFADERVDKDGTVSFHAQHAWPVRHFGAGLNQRYSHPETTIDSLHSVPEELLMYKQGTDTYPVVIHIAADVDSPKQTLSAYAMFERNSGGLLSLRPLVQKAYVNGLHLVLKEIFGIEHKEERNGSDNSDDDDEDDNTECVVCMSAAKDTMALPCRHLCLCNPCAEVLRFQANKCPICRAPFHSLLQVRVLVPEDEVPSGDEDDEDDDDAGEDEHNPPGYSSVSLAEAVEMPSRSDVSPFPPSRATGDGGDGVGDDQEKGYLDVEGYVKPSDVVPNTSTAVGPAEQSKDMIENLMKSTFTEKPSMAAAAAAAAAPTSASSGDAEASTVSAPTRRSRKLPQTPTQARGPQE